MKTHINNDSMNKDIWFSDIWAV